jgi:hypothetical protein
LTLLPLSSASAGRKNVPFRLMDGGLFKFPSPSSLSATLEGSDLSTHMGKIVSGGDFANVGPPDSGCTNGFKGAINGTATAPNGDELRYSLSADFCPDPNAPGVFNGVGTYQITGGTGRFAQAKGTGQFIG